MPGRALGVYRLDAELGSGAMGKVYRATGPAGTVAVKVVHPHLLDSPGFFKRFLREAELGKTVLHPNVVRTLDCDALGADHFLVMEFVEGQTLRGLLEELAHVPEELCRHIGREMAKGLAAIHAAGAVHRDLKPENVLITKEHAVKIMDLGVARLADEAMALSRTGAFVGSVQYASPEQFMGTGEDLDGRADLYSLGVILYELSCGEHPHPGDSFGAVLSKVVTEEPRRLGERNPQLSAFFEEVVHALLSKDREKRFESAESLLTVLTEDEKSAWWQERAKAIRTASKRPLRRIRIPRETAVYGRDGEIAKLRVLYDAAKAGDGRVVLIEGEAGIGKTRLVDEFVGRLRAEREDVNFLFGSYPPGGAATASGAWSTAYREHLGTEGLEETLKGYLTITPLLIPAFAALIRGDIPPKDTEPLTKDSIHTVFIHVTRSLAAERPTIVLIEDLHFAPEEGRALFAALSLAVPDHRILLIGTSRPGLPDSWRAGIERVEQTSWVELTRLGPKDLVRLLRDALHSEHLAEELAGKVAVKSDGNPFFVFEIIRGLREGQFITRKDDGTWVTTKVIRDIEVPSSVTDLIAARIADLDDTEQELLEVASCCGFEFDPGLVADVVGSSRIPALRRFARLEKAHRLVRSAGRWFAFDHHQVQETLYAGIPEQLREQYHAALGAALEASHPGPDPAKAVELCHHFLAGAEGRSALRHLKAALDHLDKGSLPGQMVDLAARALAVPGLLSGPARAELLLRQAGALDILGRREEQRAAIEEALRAAPDDPLEARSALAWYCCRVQDYPRAVSLLEGLLGDSALVEARRADALNMLSGVRARQGRLGEACRLVGEAVELHRKSGPSGACAGALAGQGAFLWAAGRSGEARAALEEAVRMSVEVGDRGAETNAVCEMGNWFAGEGHQAVARTWYERYLSLARQHGSRLGEAYALGNLAIIATEEGDPGEGLRLLDPAGRTHREIGNRIGQMSVLLGQGVAHTLLGQVEGAARALDQALGICGEIGLRRWSAEVRTARGELLETVGRPGEALEDAESARLYWSEVGNAREEARALARIARLMVQRGDVAAARRCLDRGRELSRAGDDPGLALRLAVLRAAFLGEDPAPALSLLAGGEPRLSHADRLEVRFLLFQVTGDRAHLAEAKRLLDFTVAHAPEDCRESMLANVRLNREIASAAKEAGL